MVLTIKSLLFIFGLVVLGIGASIVLIGPAATAAFFGGIHNSIGGGEGLPLGFESVDVDNEFRFYSVFWLAFGVMLLRAALTFPESHRMVFILMGVFFLGGLFRVLSILQFGWPHGMFQFLMWVELGVPILLSLLVLAAIRR